MFPRRSVILLAFAIDASFVSAVARAQTISPGSQPYPERLLPDGTNACGGPGSDATCVGTRPQNLTPLGVSYQDCIADQTLRFTVVLNGFDGVANLEVWASASSDCTSPTDRGGAGAAAAQCWKVSNDLLGPVINSPTSQTFDVRVQDLVGLQQLPPYPPPKNVVTQGAAACNAQPTFVAVPMSVNFLSVDSTANLAGTAYQYRIETDLVGPPAPASVAVQTGTGGLLPTWTPNTDPDTVGYDVFLAPQAGQPPQGPGCPTIPASYLVGGGGDGMTVTGESTGAYVVTGLTNGTTYALAVAGVDALDNVGPTSPVICATPDADAGLLDAGLPDAGPEGDAGPGATETGDNEGPTTLTAGCFCSHAAPATPLGVPSLVAAAAVAIAFARRRLRAREESLP
jgi:hypothetical protein